MTRFQQYFSSIVLLCVSSIMIIITIIITIIIMIIITIITIIIIMIIITIIILHIKYIKEKTYRSFCKKLSHSYLSCH